MNIVFKTGFPFTLNEQSLIRQSNIPCVCRVGKDFELTITLPDLEVLGTVRDWDPCELDARAPANGGGDTTHFNQALVTLACNKESKYEISDLSFFYSNIGWCDVLINGSYALPGLFCDEE